MIEFERQELPGSRIESHKGALITFEGGDGSGKGTQTGLTFDWLQELGLPVKKSGFPMYETPTGQLVKAYLNGEMGTDIPAEIAGLLYQDDRLANIGPIKEWLDSGGIMLLDRYVESNSGHQGGKLPTEAERIKYILDNAHTEYNKNGLPVPDLTILFTLAPELAQEYVSRKTAASRANYTDLTHDIHEADVNHLANANESFALLPQLYPHRFAHTPIVSESGLAMLPRDDIQLAVRNAIRPLLFAKGFAVTQ